MDPRRAKVQLLPARGIALVGDAVLVDLQQIAPSLRSRVDAFKRRKRRLVGRVEIERTTPGADGGGGVTEAILVHGGRAYQELTPHRAVQARPEGQNLLEQRGERDGTILVDRRQPVERREHVGASGVEPQRALPGGKRLARLGERPSPGASDLLQNLDRGDRIALVIGAHLERADELFHVAGGAVDRLENARGVHLKLRVVEVRLERGARALVYGIELERVTETLQRAPPIAERGGAGAAEPHLELADRGCVLGRGRGDLALQDLGKLARRAARLVEAIERAQGLTVGGRDIEQIAPRADRALGVLELLLEQVRALEQQLAQLFAVGHERALALEDRQQVGEAIGARVQALERVEGGQARGLSIEQARGRAQRRVGVGKLALVEAHQRLEHRNPCRGGLRLFIGLGQIRLALRRRREALGGVARPRLVGAKRDGLEREAERARQILEVALVDLGQAAQLLQPLGSRIGVPRVDGEHAGEPSRVAGRRIDRHERARRLQVFLVDREHLLVAAGRAVLLAEPLRPEAGAAEVQLHAHLRIGVDLRLALEHAHELVPLAGRRVDLLEIVEAPRLTVEFPQRIARAAAVGVVGEHALPRHDRALGIVLLLAVEDGELRQRGDSCRRVRRLADLLLEHAREISPRALALVELLELGQRQGVLGLLLEHLAPELDRQRRLLDLIGGELGDLDPAPHPFGRVGDAQKLALVRRDQLVPVAATLVHLLEKLERLRARWIELERALVGLDRLGLVRELLEVEARDAQLHLDLRGGVGQQRGLLLEHLDEIGPALERVVLRLEGVERAAALRIGGEHLVERLENHDVELEPLAVDLGHLEERRDLLVGAFGRQAFDELLERLDQRVPAAGGAVDATELAARQARARPRVRDLAPRLDALVDAQRFGGPCGFDQRLDGVVERLVVGSQESGGRDGSRRLAALLAAITVDLGSATSTSLALVRLGLRLGLISHTYLNLIPASFEPYTSSGESLSRAGLRQTHGANFAMKMSFEPAETSVASPSSHSPNVASIVNQPATATPPSGATATAKPASSEKPPAWRAHSSEPSPS